jgi:hypothetical protein
LNLQVEIIGRKAATSKCKIQDLVSNIRKRGKKGKDLFSLRENCN